MKNFLNANNALVLPYKTLLKLTSRWLFKTNMYDWDITLCKGDLLYISIE